MTSYIILPTHDSYDRPYCVGLKVYGCGYPRELINRPGYLMVIEKRKKNNVR